MAIVEELIGRLTLQTKGIDQAKKATKEIENFRKALKGLAGAARTKLDGPAQMARGIKDARREAEKLAAAQRKAAAAGGLDKANASAKQYLTTAQKLRSTLQDVAKAQASIGRGAGRSGKSWITGELDALRKYKRELQEVTRVTGRLGVPRHRTEQMARIPYGERSKYGEAIAAGTIARGAGQATRYAIEEGAKTQQETNRQTNAGMTPEQIAVLDKRATELSAQYPSVDTTTIRTMGRDARNMMPDFDKAMQILPDLVQSRVMLAASKGVQAADNELSDFLKAADIVGKTESVESVRKLLNGAVKAVAVEGNQLPLKEYKNAAKMSKAAGANIGEDFWTEIFPTFAQSEGGARFGSQIAAGTASLISGRRTKASGAALRDLGLLDKKGNLKDAAKFQDNPYTYAIENMMPALKRKKVNVDDDKEVGRWMARIFSSSMTENEFTKLITQREQVERNRKTYRGAKGNEAAKDQTRKDPYLSWEAIKSQFGNLLGTTQKENIGLAGKAGAVLAESMGDLNKRLAKDPVAAQAVGVGTGAAAAGITGAAGLKLWRILSGWFGVGKQGVAGAGGAAGKAASAAGGAVEGVTAGAAAAEGAAVTGAAAGSRGVMAVAGGILRGLLRLAPAVSAPLTMDASKEDQQKQMLKLGKYAEEQNRARDAVTEARREAQREARRGEERTRRDKQTPYGERPKLAAQEAPALDKPRAWTDPPKHDAAARTAGATAELARWTEVQAAVDKVRTTIETEMKLKVDSSDLDTALTKAKAVRAEIAAAGSAAKAASSSLSGAGLAKGSNTFTSPGATAP